jgi:hypothetical protein
MTALEKKMLFLVGKASTLMAGNKVFDSTEATKIVDEILEAIRLDPRIEALEKVGEAATKLMGYNKAAEEGSTEGANKAMFWFGNLRDEVNILEALQHKKESPVASFDYEVMHVSEIRPSVIRMARMMEGQLRANESRGGWSHCDKDYFIEKLEINLRDLTYNLAANAHKEVQRDCADLANFAMMLSENEFLRENAK